VGWLSRVAARERQEWGRMKHRTYYACGALSAITLFCSPAHAAETQSFSYDALGRLVRTDTAGGPNDSLNVSTSFDPAGNRTNYSVAGSAGLSISSPAAVTEGGVLAFPVTRSGGLSRSVSVDYATVNGAAIAGQRYTAASGTVIFAAGETSKTVTVSTIDDSTYQGTQTMSVVLSAPSAPATLGNSMATGTINDNEIAPVLSISGASANEGSSLSFVVTRSGATGSAVTASYATANGTAIAGMNYAAASGILSFAAGETSKAITISTIADNVATANLTMSVGLSSPSSGATLGTASATGTVVNTDIAPPLTALNPTINLNSGVVTSIELVTLATTGGQAATIIAFTPSVGGGSAVIASGGQSVTYTAPIVGKAPACEPAVTMTFMATYSVRATVSGTSVNGTTTFKVKGQAGSRTGVCP